VSHIVTSQYTTKRRVRLGLFSLLLYTYFYALILHYGVYSTESSLSLLLTSLLYSCRPIGYCSASPRPSCDTAYFTQSIMEYNGGSVVAMVGKNCVAIASDLRLGNQALNVATFDKVQYSLSAVAVTELVLPFKPCRYSPSPTVYTLVYRVWQLMC